MPLKIPPAVGVPSIRPLAGLSARPGGNAPENTLKVGAGAPLAATACEYGWPKVPPGGNALVIAGGAGTNGVTAFDGEEGAPPPAGLFARTVKV